MFEADQTSGGARWPLVRVAAGSETVVTLLSGRMLPLTVHWAERSVPCCGSDCPLCSWLPARALFYLPVICMQRVSILELASLSSSHFEQHCKLLHGGVRAGLVLRLTRRSQKAPIFSEVIDEKKGVKDVSLVELAAKVMALYQLPAPNVAEELESYSARCAHITRIRAERILAKLKSSNQQSSSSR